METPTWLLVLFFGAAMILVFVLILYFVWRRPPEVATLCGEGGGMTPAPRTTGTGG
jgi:hypothetical protein